MDSAGQAACIGLSCSALIGKGIHAPHRSTPAPTDPGPVGEEC